MRTRPAFKRKRACVQSHTQHRCSRMHLFPTPKAQMVSSCAGACTRIGRGSLYCGRERSGCGRWRRQVCREALRAALDQAQARRTEAGGANTFTCQVVSVFVRGLVQFLLVYLWPCSHRDAIALMGFRPWCVTLRRHRTPEARCNRRRTLYRDSPTRARA